MSSLEARPHRPAVPYILAACTAVSVLSTDLITPSIPDLPAALGTTITAAQLTVSVNLAAYAVAQLLHGPVADAIGRRRLLISAFLLFALVSVFSATATGIGTLLTGRFLQGLFSSVPSVVIVLMIRELYGPRHALGVMTLYGATLGIAPAFGPLMGGYLHVWFGWQAGFWFIAGLALMVVLALWRYVPESLPERKPFNPAGAARDYARLLANRRFMAVTLALSLAFGAFYAYVTTAPVIFIDRLGLPTERYGLTNLVIIASFVAGNIIAARLGRNHSPERLLRRAFPVMAAAMAGLLLPILAGVTAIPAVLAAMAVYGACLAFILAAGPLVALNAASGPQGPAAALLGSLHLGASSLAGYLSALFYNGTALPMALVMAGSVAIGAALFLSQPPAPEPAAADETG